MEMCEQLTPKLLNQGVRRPSLAEHVPPLPPKAPCEFSVHFVLTLCTVVGVLAGSSFKSTRHGHPLIK